MNSIRYNTLREETFGREKYIYPKLDEFNVKQTYAFTINLNPAIFNKKSLLELVMMVEDMILKKYFSKASYELRPELSHNSQLLHYHGTIRFKRAFDIVEFYRNIAELKDICTFAIKPIFSHVEWYIYCRKQRHMLKPYIDEVYNSKKPVVPYRLLNPN